MYFQIHLVTIVDCHSPNIRLIMPEESRQLFVVLLPVGQQKTNTIKHLQLNFKRLTRSQVELTLHKENLVLPCISGQLIICSEMDSCDLSIASFGKHQYSKGRRRKKLESFGAVKAASERSKRRSGGSRIHKWRKREELLGLLCFFCGAVVLYRMNETMNKC